MSGEGSLARNDPRANGASVLPRTYGMPRRDKGFLKLGDLISLSNLLTSIGPTSCRSAMLEVARHPPTGKHEKTVLGPCYPSQH
jgi:hypothetical protein